MRRQLALHPNDIDARFQLARALAWQNRHAEAIAEYSRLLKVRPENSDYLLGLAQVHLWRGAPEQSLPLLQKARRLAPKYEDVWRTQILVLLALADPAARAQARKIRDQARALFPRSEWVFAQLDATPNPPATVIAASPASEPVAVPLTPVQPAPPVATAPAITAAAVPPDRYEWEAGAAYESLTNGLPAWRSRYVVGEWHMPEKKSLYAGLRETERYALNDRQAHLGGVLPLNPETSVQLEAGFSDSHRVLPARYGLAQWQYQAAPGWVLGAGLRISVYDLGIARVANFGIDRYLGQERFGYTLYEGGPDGSGLSPSHRWQWAHYYGERDWIGVTLTKGRETENTGSAGFLTAQVSGASLSGRHSIGASWTLVWDAGRQRQGDLYSRRGVSLGLRHAF